MLISLELTNFGKHESLTINFTPGLNVIRAANEAGKSTMLTALGYAWWGARFLPLSIDETVTWGKPASALKVKHSFTVDGAEFTVTRSKSGAELIGPGVTVSGHEAVTNFICNLFGADMKTGAAVLFAKQGTLQDSLEGTAVGLIEQLSGMDVIDSALTKLQEKLPCGNTKTVEAHIASYEGLNLPQPPGPEYEAAVTAAAAVMEPARIAVTDAETALASATPGKAAAEAAIVEITKADAQRAVHKAASARLQGLQPPATPVFEQSLEELQAKAAEQADFLRRKQAYDSIVVRDDYVKRDWAVKEEADLTKTISDSRSAISTLKTEIAVLKTTLILETACGLCGKDLQNVPEVVEKNAAAQKSIEEKEAKLATYSYVLNNATDMLKVITALQSADAAVNKQYLKYEGLIHLDATYLPAKPSWVGEPVGEVDSTDYAGAIAKMTAATAKYNAALGAYNRDLETLKAAEAALAQLGEPREKAEHEAVLDSFKLLEAAKQKAILAYNATTADYAAKVKAAEHAESLYKQALKTHEDALAKKAALISTVSEMNKNNAVIKKLREARPIVARELWNNVLQGVSTVFSSIRGTPSVATRNADSFLIDGKPYKAYSGSTKDALGVAIRTMLQKTFLPKFNSIIFDEPAAGADETREEALIATLSRAEFSQLLLVTHSNLADVHAANIITI